MQQLRQQIMDRMFFRQEASGGQHDDLYDTRQQRWQMKNIRIGDVLLRVSYINQNELDEALEYQKNNKGIRLGEALIKLGFITEHQQLEALSARLGQRYVKIDRIMRQTEAVAMIPVQLAKRNIICLLCSTRIIILQLY